MAAQIAQGKADENLAAADVEPFPLDSRKDFDQPCSVKFSYFGGHVSWRLK